MKRRYPLISRLGVWLVFCHPFLRAIAAEPVDDVNPLIGTDAHGHVYPGATVPFGMVQLSPDTRDNGLGRFLRLSLFRHQHPGLFAQSPDRHRLPGFGQYSSHADRWRIEAWFPARSQGKVIMPVFRTIDEIARPGYYQVSCRIIR